MIYFDYNATTPIDKKVADAMMPYLYGNFGNPSSTHEVGIAAKKAIENARVQVAKLINCEAEEITFTSCGSESNNTVIKGVDSHHNHAFKQRDGYFAADKGNFRDCPQTQHFNSYRRFPISRESSNRYT